MKIEKRNVLHEEMKNTNFGVEIEFSCMSPAYCIDLICNEFEWTKNGSRFYDNDGREWKIVSDGSVCYGEGTESEGCGELVTPLLKYEDIETLQKIVRLMRVHGAKSNNNFGCGVHIHVDSKLRSNNGVYTLTGDNSINEKTARNIVNLIHNYFKIMCLGINISSSRYREGGYCGDFSDSFIRLLNTSRIRNMEDFYNVWYSRENSGGGRPTTTHYDSSRYHICNFHSTYCRGSVEFRLFEFHKNMHAGELKAYIQLCLAMVAYSKMVNRVKLTSVNIDNQRYTMKSFLNNIGLQGEEFKTCRKMLNKRLSGDSAYKNGRPVSDNLDDTNIITD